MARGGGMVAYQGDVRFEHKGGGLGRMIKKAASGEDLRLMTCTGTGELFLANQAMLVHVLRLDNESLTVNGKNILAFEAQIEWDVTRVKGGAAGVLAGGLFNIALRGSGLVALCSDGQPMKLDVSRGADVRRPAGGDRVVGRRHDDAEDRHAGQVARRLRLGREPAARLHRPGLGAHPAVGGPAGRDGGLTLRVSAGRVLLAGVLLRQELLL